MVNWWGEDLLTNFIFIFESMSDLHHAFYSLTTPFKKMNSIQHNQIEENYKKLGVSDAVMKVKELVDKAQICFSSTAPLGNDTHAPRPMNVRLLDNDGNLWFLSSSDNHKNIEIGKCPNVRLYFQGSPHSDFLLLTGYASISKDKEIIKKLWEPVIKTWFTEGVDDPRITVIKVSPRKWLLLGDET